mmetsp:Transcript_8639/g.17968  ORF Transcript_8639/g.17968 Transcript_8639/m.17968 type:complete len:98 (-) Transcript_8639:48-341(-)
MIDQLVSARGEIFFGCYFSTFTGYITRLRGFHSQLRKEPGFRQGLLMSSYYYAPQDKRMQMHKYYPVKQPFFAREFPTAWRLLDRDIRHENATRIGR